MTNNREKRIKRLVSLATPFVLFAVQAKQELSLQEAIATAQANDPWLHGSQLHQQAAQHRSNASNTLPDPKVSVGLMNLPTDSWDFAQEGMTQLKLGVSQMFPRGDSLAIQSSKFNIEAEKYPLLRQQRKAMIKVKVSELWLDAYLAQQTIALIEQDAQLFEQMAEVAKASYSNALGKTRQQDVIRAQLEIVQLEDRLTSQKQKQDTSMAKLSQWLHTYDATSFATSFDFANQSHSMSVSQHLPRILPNPAVDQVKFSANAIALRLKKHPAVMALDIKQKMAQKNIELAEQKFKPQWGVSASYAYRDDMPTGNERADLFSVGVTFDLPLFTQNKQDQELAASVAKSEAVKTEKLLLLKQMMSQLDKEYRLLSRLSERQALYQNQLLQQSHQQAEASLTAYTNDDGDFAEVVRAKIAELNAKIAALKIDVEKLKTIARMNYYFVEVHAEQKNEKMIHREKKNSEKNETFAQSGWGTKTQRQGE